MGSVSRPVALKVQAELESVLVADEAEVIQEVEALVSLVIREARLGRDAGRIRDEVEERLRHDVVDISARIQLTQSEPVGAALYRIKVIGNRAAKQVIRRTSLLLTGEADAELIDHGRGEGVGPVDDGAVGEVLVMALEDWQVAAIAQRAAAIRARIGVPRAGIHGDRILFVRIVVQLQRVQALRDIAVILPLKVIVPPGKGSVELVGQRHQVHQNEPVGIEPIVRNLIAREWTVVVQGISDHPEVARLVDGLREIAGALERGRHGNVSDTLRQLSPPRLVREEEKQLVAIAVEVPWDEDRPANGGANVPEAV